MGSINSFFLLFFLFQHVLFAAPIKVLYTAALIDDQFEYRRDEYLKSLALLDAHGYLSRTYVVDSCAKTDRSFFEEHLEHVLYANTNDLRLRNKGGNEARALIAALNHFNFDDEEIILKLTGRYYLDSDLFLKTIESHPDVDVFVKFDQWGQAFTGCYAIRCRLLKEQLAAIDLSELEERSICIETKVAEFIHQVEEEGRAKVKVLDRLDVTANIFGWGTPSLTYW